jgi:hypothetical protein
MKPLHRTIRAFAIALAASLLIVIVAPYATRSMSAATTKYYVSPIGADTNDGTTAATPFKTIQKAVDLAQPGAVITLAAGNYLQDVHSTRDGAVGAPITIAGPANAVVKGGGNARIFEINHDNISLTGFTIDGLWGDPNSLSGYRDKLLYVLGKQPGDGVSGLKVFNMSFKNAGGECIRLRYFAQHNEIARSTITRCGVHDFQFNAGGKNGEGIYIGTAPEQRADGKNPTADADQSSNNWIHDNTFNTQGNECVDIKEASSSNIVEHNTCTGQRDPESGGFDARGSGNIFRANQSFGNAGAGVRLGGDASTDGTDNDIYGNTIHDNMSGGIKFQRMPQGAICGNDMANNAGGDAVGTYGGSFKPAALCIDGPANTGGTLLPTSTPAQAPTSSPTQAPTSTPAPVPPDPTALPATCIRFYTIDGGTHSFIEAEQYTSLSGRFMTVAEGRRSGGASMTIPGAGMHKDSNTYLTFNIDITRGGTFYVWLLGYGPDDRADSFFVQSDGGGRVRANLTRKTWSWKRAGTTITLDDGAHILKLMNREDGASADKILLTRDKDYVPKGLGEAGLIPQCR